MAPSPPRGGQDQVKLRVENLYLYFGGMLALGGVSFDVKEGEILAIIGPNGAGKTCTLNCVNGFYRPQRGEIFYEGQRITLNPPHRIAELGISRTFQNIELFTGLSTLDNLMAARHIHMRRGALAGFLYFGPMRREEIAHRRIVEEIIDFLELESVRKKTVGLLPYGLRKRVELGRALALEPRLAKDVVQRIRRAVDSAAVGKSPVLLSSANVRMYVRQLIERFLPGAAVLSHNEIPPNVRVTSVGMVS